MPSADIDALRDYGFEGSNDELRTSQEVLNGCYSADTGRRSPVTEVVDDMSGQSKFAEMFHCPSSEELFLKSQPFSQSFCLKDAETSFGLSEGKFPTMNSSEGIGFVERDPRTASAKRLELSSNHISNLDPCLEEAFVSSMPLTEFASGAHQPIPPPVGPGLMFNVVESSGEGVISNRYMLPQGVDGIKEADFGSRDGSKSNLSGSCISKGNTSDVHEAIASPDSQESFATKTLAVGPSAPFANQPGSHSAGRKRKRYPPDGPSVEFDDDILLKGKGAKDPRVLLRHKTFCLLREAGWSIEQRKRNCRVYAEFLYRTPEGKPVREFTKAWEMCGKRLLAPGTIQYLEEKQWNDIKKFWSDLFDTLRTIDNEMNEWVPEAALALKWALLDPFAIVVFIDRKVLAIKSGNLVRVRSSVADKDSKSGAGPSSKSVENDNDRVCEGPASTAYYDSSLPTESPVSDFVGGQCQGAAVQTPLTRSVYLSEGSSMTLLETHNDSEKCNEETFAAKTRDGSSTASRSCTAHLTCLHSAGCLFDVPLDFGNFEMVDRHSETFSSQQGSFSISSPGFNKQNSQPILETAKDARALLFEERDGPLGRRVMNEDMHQNIVADDHPNCTNSELLQFSGSNEVCVPYRKTIDAGFSSQKESLVENSHCLEKKSSDLASDVVNGRQQVYPEPSVSDVDQKFGEVVVKYAECFQSIKAACHSLNFDSKKKMHKKSKKISEIDSTTLRVSKRSDERNHVKLSEMGERSEVDAQVGDNCVKLSSGGSQHSSGKKKKWRCRKFDCDGISEGDFSEVKFGKAKAVGGSKSRKKSRKSCQLKDDDLLITAIIQKKSGGASRGPKASKPKTSKRGISQKGSCRLRPSCVSKGGKDMTDSRWSGLGRRTVLFWLISMGEISLDEVIQFRDSKDDSVKHGLITRDGILCKCCSELLSLSRFKVHAGFEPNSPCMNLFMDSGKPLTMCQLQAWSIECKAKQGDPPTVQVDDSDHNDDSCGWCGDGGELLCCDNCPSTYHQSCILTEELPEGSWYCPSCSCRSCGSLVDEKEASSADAAFNCSQCQHKYHGDCLGGKGLTKIGSNLWFCSGGCDEVYSGLHSRIGVSNDLDDGFSWSLLRCIHDDQKIHSAQWFALKAECNSKLAVALTIMEECFVSMVDPRTGINMIPHVIFNRGSEFSRLNYHGFYTAVLEKDDVLVAVASIRVHGTKLAELPLVATCSKYRRQGMCRRLLSSIEEMLISFKVEKLIVAAIPSLVETWTVGFGFVPMEEDEKRSLNKTSLMVFPETVMLKKTLYVNQGSDSSQNDATNSPVKREESAKAEAGTRQGPITESTHEESGTCHTEEVVDESGIKTMDLLVQEGTEGDKTAEAAAKAQSNLDVPSSLANKNEDTEGTVPESKFTNMEVDFGEEINEGKCTNLTPEDTHPTQFRDAPIIESIDMTALQITGDECSGKPDLRPEDDVDDKDMSLQHDENGNDGKPGTSKDLHSGEDGLVAEIGSSSAAKEEENGPTNPVSELCIGEASGEHVLDGKTPSTPLDPDNDEEQAILEAFFAVKAAFSNYVGRLPH